MALQDLTPQLRTRLSRMERAVGWFVLLATLMFISGFVYYIYTTAENKGWFKRKAPFFIYVDRATGLKVGDPVQMMGFDVGQITVITATKPEDWEHNVYLEFLVKEPNIGYLWTAGSRAQVTTADLLGKRVLEVTKGTNGYPIYTFNPFEPHLSIAEAESLPDLNKWKLGEEIYDATGTNLVIKAWVPLSVELLHKIAALGKREIRAADSRTEKKQLTAVWNNQAGWFEPFLKTNLYLLPKDETPALTDRAQALVAQVEAALPNFLRLTNEITTVLTNSAQLTSNLNIVAASMRPMITNLTVISEHLKEPQGSLGEWIIPTNMSPKLDTVLQNANLTLTNANTNLSVLADELSRSLDSLANVTSNLNNQVQANTNILTHISDAIVHSDQFVQGLKRHWLFRSAFRTPKTNTPSAQVAEPARSPRDKTNRGE